MILREFRATPQGTVADVVYVQDVVGDQADADPVMLAGGVWYALSPWIDLYTTAAHVKGGNGRQVSLSRDEAGYSNTATQQRSNAATQQRSIMV